MTFEIQDWSNLKQKISEKCTSEIARNTIINLKPFPSPKEATERLQTILEGQRILADTGIRPFMSSLDIFPTWFPLIQKQALLKILQIKDIRLFSMEALALKEVLKIQSSNWAQSLCSQLMDAEEIISAIDQVITPSGDIRADASEKLYQLFTEKERLGREVQGHLDRLVKSHQLENLLQDRYVTTREGRWVLPIKSGMQHFLPGMIHGSSQTKQTVFMEPQEIQPLNNRLRQIEIDIEDEIERLLTELSKYLTQKKGDFFNSREKMEEADSIFAFAQFNTLVDGREFIFSENEILLKQLRNPLLVLTGREVVSNEIDLNEKKTILLLSGPNAGGKTVLLKSIGLAAQMAKCGLPICASAQSKIPFFNTLIASIGDSQSVDEDLSTFAAHLKVLQSSVNLKGFSNLVLIDEICGSTDPEEGSALARSFIEQFIQNHIFAIITSHLGPLKVGWSKDGQLLNGSMEYNPESGRPTYQFMPGVPGESLALQTAKRVGINQIILSRAVELLSPETRKKHEFMEEFEKIKHETFNLQAHYQKEIKLAKDLQSKYEKLKSDLEKDKAKILEKALKEANKKVEEAIQHAQTQEVFKRHRELQEIKFQLPEIINAKDVISRSHEERLDSAESFSTRYPPGSKIYVPSLKQDGIIQTTPNSKGEVLVLSGSIRLALNWKDLKPPMQNSNPTSEILRKYGHADISLMQEEPKIDLRGKTVEEALKEVEGALDQALLRNRDRIQIIHGHGTEALKKAVRSFLSRSILVKKWKSGGVEGGGDGTTWVELQDQNQVG